MRVFVCDEIVSGEIETAVLLQFTRSHNKTAVVVVVAAVAAAKSCDRVIMPIHVDFFHSSICLSVCLSFVAFGRGFCYLSAFHRWL